MIATTQMACLSPPRDLRQVANPANAHSRTLRLNSRIWTTPPLPLWWDTRVSRRSTMVHTLGNKNMVYRQKISRNVTRPTGGGLYVGRNFEDAHARGTRERKRSTHLVILFLRIPCRPHIARYCFPVCSSVDKLLNADDPLCSKCWSLNSIYFCKESSHSASRMKTHTIILTVICINNSLGFRSLVSSEENRSFTV